MGTLEFAATDSTGTDDATNSTVALTCENVVLPR